MESKTLLRATTIGLTFFLAGIVASCSSSDEKDTPVDLTQQPITFATDINDGAFTRAIDATWETDDEVGVYMLDTSYKLSENHHKANKRYKALEDPDALPTWKLEPYAATENLYYPVDGSEVRFIAYYPYKDLTDPANGTVTAGTAPDVVPGTYAVALGNQATTKTFDLLYHKGETSYDKSDNPVSGMAFKHQLSKVVIKIKLATDMAGAEIANMAVTIKDIPTTATFNLATGAFSSVGTEGNVTTNALAAPTKDAPDGDGVVRIHEAIIVPHASADETNFSDRSIELAFVDPDGINVTLVYNIPDTDADATPPTTYKAFSPEKKTIYVFTLTRHRIIVENTTVTDWEKDGSDIEETLY
jgi:endonuclease G